MTTSQLTNRHLILPAMTVLALLAVLPPCSSARPPHPPRAAGRRRPTSPPGRRSSGVAWTWSGTRWLGPSPTPFSCTATGSVDLPGDGVAITFYGAGAIISGLNHGGFSYYFQVRANNARALRIGPNIFICPVHRSIHRATRITLTLSAVEAATRLAVNGTQVASQNAMVALPDLGGDSELYDIDGPASRRLRRLIVQSRDRP